MSGRMHARFGNDGGPARQRAELARNHRGDVAHRNAFRQKRGHDLRQLGPGGAEVVRIVRLIDLVAERNRLADPQPQQVARRQRADDVAGLVNHAEVTDLQPVHAADRAIHECIGRNHSERRAHELPNRHRERRRPVRGEGAQDVALGDDAGVSSGKVGCPLKLRMNEQRRDALRQHFGDCSIKLCTRQR